MIEVLSVTEKDLDVKLKLRKANIAVIGLGYVGLPLAVGFAEADIQVTGYDIDEMRVQEINQGRSHILDVANQVLQPLVKKGKLAASHDFSNLRNDDVIFICVPTPFTKAKDPDISYIESAAIAVSEVLRPEQLIVLQSTTFPGTTMEIVRPILEKSGLRAGIDFYLAFSPERIDPGNKNYSAKNTPKIVGGMDEKSTKLACEVFEFLMNKKDIHPVSSPGVAEMCKLLENSFRSVNIALVNELAMLCYRMKLDVFEVIDAAATKPFGYMPFYPGPGVGGHCIPVDPYYLSWKAREYNFYTNFIELAAEVNQGMPLYAINRLAEILNFNGKAIRNSRILIMGVTFKKNIPDTRNSPAIEMLQILLERGADVSYTDPFVLTLHLGESDHPAQNKESHEMHSVKIDEDLLRTCDCVLIAVPHDRFDLKQVVEHSSLVFDTVNATGKIIGRSSDKIHKL